MNENTEEGGRTVGGRNISPGRMGGGAREGLRVGYIVKATAESRRLTGEGRDVEAVPHFGNFSSKELSLVFPRINRIIASWPSPPSRCLHARPPAFRLPPSAFRLAWAPPWPLFGSLYGLLNLKASFLSRPRKRVILSHSRRTHTNVTGERCSAVPHRIYWHLAFSLAWKLLPRINAISARQGLDVTPISSSLWSGLGIKEGGSRLHACCRPKSSLEGMSLPTDISLDLFLAIENRDHAPKATTSICPTHCV